MKRRYETVKFIFGDWLAAVLAWGLFYSYRKLFVELTASGQKVPFTLDEKFWIGILLIPFLWIAVYALTGTYRNVYRRSRLKELGQTFSISLIGVLLIFFTLLLDDIIVNYKSYYQTFFALFILHFGLDGIYPADTCHQCHPPHSEKENCI
jgi:hypothetical protein